ncbi:MAG: hypothetical protein RSE51_03165 [Bacteroidales bacterium]
MSLKIKEQGSFMTGGSIIHDSGTFNNATPRSPVGQTYRGDHAYISYQIPDNNRKFPLVFLHGADESGKCWEERAKEPKEFYDNNL